MCNVRKIKVNYFLYALCTDTNFPSKFVRMELQDVDLPGLGNESGLKNGRD
jgi:hypothetical protein